MRTFAAKIHFPWICPESSEEVWRAKEEALEQELTRRIAEARPAKAAQARKRRDNELPRRGDSQDRGRDITAHSYVFFDLENLAFAAGGVGPLQNACERSGIEFRAYCSPHHSKASLATHLSRSSEKEAADIRMVLDASKCLQHGRFPRLLIVTNDLFGRTLMHEEPDRITHVEFDADLPDPWNKQIGARSIEDFFARIGIFRLRSSRAPSVCSDRTDRSRSSSVHTRASWSRATSQVPSRAGSRAGSVGRAPRAGSISPPSSRRAKPAARNMLDANAVRANLRTHSSRKKRGPRKWPRAVCPSSGKQVGTIKRWIPKGYGFITPRSGGSDVFVHISTIKILRAPGLDKQQIHELTNWDVEFRIKSSPKGPQAYDVSGPNGCLLPADTAEGSLPYSEYS